jgi:hypothetical protein
MNKRHLVPLLFSVLTLGAAQAVTMERESLSAVCATSKSVVNATIDKAELVRAAGKGNAPTMCYRLTDVEQIAGAPVSAGAKLCYLGDLQSDSRLEVAGLRYPQVGERGIFFIDRVSDPKVISPLRGWNQGHYTIAVSAQGQSLVRSASGAAVCEGGFDQQLHNIDPDAAFDLKLESSKDKCRPISVPSFIEQIRACATKN